MAQHTDEIDLMQVYGMVKTFTRKILVSIYNLLLFIFKYWYIVAGLLVLGVALGYFSDKQSKNELESNVLARINFDAPNYVYLAITDLNAKIDDRDSVYLKSLGLWDKESLIKNIEISPIKRVEEVLEEYDYNQSRNLELMVENLDGLKTQEEGFDASLYTYFKYHNIKFELTPEANEEVLNKFFDHINNIPILLAYKKAYLDNMDARIENYAGIIKQIDDIIDAKNNDSNESQKGMTSSSEFDLSELLRLKASYFKDSDWIKEEKVLSQEVLVTMNKPIISNTVVGIGGNKKIVYPLIFLGIFFGGALGMQLFRGLKQIAEEEGRS